MGKSPGKWIKNVLLGKKSSKSKGKDGLNANTRIALKASPADLVGPPPNIPEEANGTVQRNGNSTNLEKGTGSNLPCEQVVVLNQKQDTEDQDLTPFGELNDNERTRLEEAVTKAQAAFRGYLARRAFRALRGIIRLQALIRGHLVRRQALSTVRCLLGVVKLQASVRGQRVKLRFVQDAKRLDSTGANTLTEREKPQLNAFVAKFLGSSSKTIYLRLQYGQDDPNGAWVWLERWTSTRFWEPFLQPKKETGLKSKTKPGIFQHVVIDPSRSKHVFRRNPVPNVDNGSTLSTSVSEKPKRNLRKASAHHVDPVQDHPQSELEKVKRNLRKISNSTVEPTDQLEVETETPKKNVRTKPIDEPNEKIQKPSTVAATEQPDILVESVKQMHIMREESSSPTHDILEERTEKCTENTEHATEGFKPTDNEPSIEHSPADGAVNVLHKGHAPVELPPLGITEEDRNVPLTKTELIQKEEQKTSKRRASLPAKQENLENRLERIPRQPSYMAATESAKAKLRGQDSPRFVQDGAENNGFSRRHSLPSPTSAKLNILPRTQRVAQTNGKGVTKNDRSLLSSRDGKDKVVQAEWRR